MKNILINNEKELYTKCTDMTPHEIVKNKKIVYDVLDTFINFEHCIGVGLAANQIGYTKRFIVISESSKVSSLFTMINPLIVNHGRDIVYEDEMCLSYPNRKENIGRYRVITVEYYNANWEKKIEVFKGYVARIIQHEVDHLNGRDCLKNRL